MNRGTVQKVFGRRAAGYVDSASHADQEVLRRVAEMCGDASGKDVLDVATGTGHTALQLAPRSGRVVGLDLTREMLEMARVEMERRGINNIHWIRGDVISLPFPDRSFEVVCCRRAPHHFPYLNAALKEMARVLRDGGTMVMDDRSVPDDAEVDEVMNLLDRLHDPSHVREYGRRYWERALRRAGLELKEAFEYRRHLPLSTLTWNAEEADAREIERVVAALPKGLRERMSVEEVDGTVYLDHYYLTLRATK